MNSIDFYQNHLNRVSRSFAFCIAKLESPMREWVSSTYLICRILDTIEDAHWDSSSSQMQQFQCFDKALLNAAAVRDMSQWLGDFPAEISGAERQLLQDSEALLRDLHSFPEKARTTIQAMVSSMSAGMKYFIVRKQAGELKLSRIEDLNLYCFFVAGVVGEALTRLLAHDDRQVEIDRKILNKSHHFGLFLQKINILKDRMIDENEGRFFIPSVTEVWESLSVHCRAAMDYILWIPRGHRDYRIFCAWSFFLGLASLPYIRQSLDEKKQRKISRLETMRLLSLVENKIEDDQALLHLYKDLMGKSQVKLNQSSPFEEQNKSLPQWLQDLYKGDHHCLQAYSLGLLPRVAL